ncbi:MAG: hypothetical protein EBU26_04180, partial [Verrucomicrobia bacterium]|nr:hypothetical protein [Verrucomicrobiota bacterium]
MTKALLTYRGYCLLMLGISLLNPFPLLADRAEDIVILDANAASHLGLQTVTVSAETFDLKTPQVTNEGEPDSTLTLRKLLIKRIDELQKNNETSTIDDIGLTHNLFLTSNFKPFVATASTYLNNDISYFNLGTFATIYLDQLVSGDFINDMYLDVTFDEIGNKNDDSSKSYKYRYTNYPGIRLLEKVELWLDSKKVDSYTSDDVLFYLNCELDMEKRNAYMSCVGESSINNSYTYNKDKEYELITNIKSGYQTFKNYHKRLHMQIPLLFWFNKYIEKSYPVIKQATMNLDNSKNFIKVWFADIDKIIQVGKFDEENKT